MSRHLTPRPIRASGARDAHGRILEPAQGALYIHVHRERGLAHRHYVLKPWQVRLVAILLSKPLLLVYFVALVTWGWMAGQTARVPLLERELIHLREDAERLDTLTVTLNELQARYDQVQKMLSAATAGRAGTPSTPRPVRDAVRRDTVARDTIRRDSVRPDSGTPARETNNHERETLWHSWERSSTP